MSDDARQRAREAMRRVFLAHGMGVTAEPFVAAIEAYFDERTRGEAPADDRALGVTMLRERLTASQRYVAELEAVVSAADEMRGELRCRCTCDETPRIADHGPCRCGYCETSALYDTARAKVEVPRG